MTSPQPHPRRRYLNFTHPIITQLPSPRHDATTQLNTISHLKKSATFHSPRSPPSTEHDPILSIPSLPRRSLTCPKTLENILAAHDKHINGISQIIGAVDRSLSGSSSFSSENQDTIAGESLPVPRFMLDAHIDFDDMNVDPLTQDTHKCPNQSNHKHHSSDSGIGSTVSSSETWKFEEGTDLGNGMINAADQVFGNSYLQTKGHTSSISLQIHEDNVESGINGLATHATETAVGFQRVLSEYACKQIQKHIILPIIREDKLKAFHPLVTGIPYRVARKEITCLRDLEKVLLWLAPVSTYPPSSSSRSIVLGLIIALKKRSVSEASFVNFCETSIQCIHTTVEHLNEYDQCRPTDRPYTNGYFLDLVEQVRQYATMLAGNGASTAAHSNCDGVQSIALVSPLHHFLGRMLIVPVVNTSALLED